MNILSAPAAAKIAVALFAGAVAMGGSLAASAAVNETIYEAVSTTEETPIVVEEGTDPDVEDGTDPVVDDGTDPVVDDGTDDGDVAKVSGNSAWGHCNARSHGGLSEHSTAGTAFDAAAGGDVEAYCATITKKNGKDKANVGEVPEDGDDSVVGEDGVDEDGDDETEVADSTTTEKTHGNSGNNGKGKGKNR